VSDTRNRQAGSAEVVHVAAGLAHSSFCLARATLTRLRGAYSRDAWELAMLAPSSVWEE